MVRCPVCGQENSPEQQGCTRCGRPLPPAQAEVVPPQAERRQVTVLFADLAGFTGLGEQMDPEGLAKLLGRYIGLLTASVYRFGGTVDKFLGDGVMALFGAPLAHEDDPALAVRCALDMQEKIAQAAQDQETPSLGVHIGINTGEVLAGLVGPEGAAQYTVIGDTVNLASRLSDLAEPGEILVGPLTHTLTQRLFRYEPLPPVRVKGRREAVAVYRVLAAEGDRFQARGFEQADIPLQGRKKELAALQGAVAALLEGRGGVLSVIGEAGLGKSRLVTEAQGWACRAFGERLAWHEGRGLPYGFAPAYAPIVEMLRNALGLPENAPAAEIASLLNRLGQDLFPDEPNCLEPLAVLFSPAPLEEEDPRYPKARARHEQVVLALRRLLAALAGRRPLVLALDDLHWADPAAVSLWQELLPLVHSAPLLLIGVYRPERGHACWQWREEARRCGSCYIELSLSPLSPEESLGLLASILGEGVPSSEMQEAVLSLTEGNPFYLEEVVRSWMQSGLLVREQGQWTLRGPPRPAGVPQTLRGVIQARLDRLPPETRYLLQIAAAIGRIFRREELAAAVGQRTALQQHLQLAEEAALIRRRGERRDEYIFKHSLTQEVAYHTMLQEERRCLHRRLGEHLQQRHADRPEEVADLLAYHFDRAAAWPEAFRYHILAGDRARSLYANQEATAHYRRALEVLAQEPKVGTPEQTVRLWENLGDVQAFVGQYDQALASYCQGLGACPGERLQALLYWRIGQVHERKGETDLALEYLNRALELLGEESRSSDVVSVRTGLGWAHYYRGEYDLALQEGLAGLEIARERGYRRPLGDLLTLVAISFYEKGDYDRAEAFCREGLEISRAEGWNYELARLYSTLGTIAHGRGDYAQAIIHHRQSLEIRQKIGDRRGIGIAYNNLATALQESGHFQEALEHLQESLAIWIELDDPLGSTIVHSNIGQLYCNLERWGVARQHLEQALTVCQERSVRAVLSFALFVLAWVDLEEGQTDQAQRHAQESLRLAQETGNRWEEGAAWRMLGRIAAHRGRWEEAERAFETSLTLFRELGSQIEEGRTHHARALALVRQECMEQARQALRQAEDCFVAVRMDWELERVRQDRDRWGL